MAKSKRAVERGRPQRLKDPKPVCVLLDSTQRSRIAAVVKRDDLGSFAAGLRHLLNVAIEAGE